MSLGQRCTRTTLTRLFPPVLLLLQLYAAAALSGPASGVLIPANPLGSPNPTLHPEDPTYIPVQPSQIAFCAQDANITAWHLSTIHTNLNVGINYNVKDFLGAISATCSDGTRLPTVQYSYDNDASCKAVQNATTSLEAAQDVYASAQSPASYGSSGGQGFNSIYYSSGAWMDSVLGKGGNSGSYGSSQCPGGSNIIGFIAAPSCYAVTHVQFICADAA